MTEPRPVRWGDEHDPAVQAALTLRCGACKALPGDWCRNTVNGEPLINVGRWVHFYRLDKLLTADDAA